ncbi:MAG: purine-nucleoside phosphorylase [Actinobacteria bacterium RBG_16_68_21]|nr:MAG: purine-nucleoside phosphorylase [Actinobacteria bacterium RBG_16_68_21]
MNYDAVEDAAVEIARATGRSGHALAVVLGSGLSDYASTLPKARELPYAQIPGFPVPRVEGHAGSLFSIDLDGTPAMILAGRVHAYEGWDLDDVVFAVRTAIRSGCRTVLLTNAAGGCGDGLTPGDLVLITDHLNLTGRNPLVGANDSRLGPRFPDMSAVYRPELRALVKTVGARVGVPVKEGVYAWFLGPSYETPAEVQMARRLGADVVGMSTVPEAIAARHMGAQVVAISLVTNLAAGISPVPLSHEEVTATALAARERVTTLLGALLAELAVA